MNHTSIKWIKGVTRNHGEYWAYLEEELKDQAWFPLNWPKNRKENVLKPAVGDLIVLYQRPEQVKGGKKIKVFTHIVSPTNKLRVYNDLMPHPWERECDIIAILNKNTAINVPKHIFLKNLVWGSCVAISQLAKQSNFTTEELQKEIWNMFFENSKSKLGHITKENVLSAIAQIDKEGEHERRISLDYKIVYDGRLYSPKYVISVANQYSVQREFLNHDKFNSIEANTHLRKLNFSILRLADLENVVIDEFVKGEKGNVEERVKKALAKIPDGSKKRIIEQSDRQDTPLIRALKELYNYECQFPGCKTKILKRDGGIYIEIAHIVAVKDGGKSVVENLIPLCPNHHKEFDYGMREIHSKNESECNGVLNSVPFQFKFRIK